MVGIGPVRVHIKSHMFIYVDMNCCGKGYGYLPLAGTVIEIQSSSCVKIDRRHRIIVITVLGSMAMCRSPWRRARFRSWCWNVNGTLLDNDCVIVTTGGYYPKSHRKQ